MTHQTSTPKKKKKKKKKELEVVSGTRIWEKEKGLLLLLTCGEGRQVVECNTPVLVLVVVVKPKYVHILGMCAGLQ